MSSTLKKIKETLRKEPAAHRSEVQVLCNDLAKRNAGAHKHKNARRAKDNRNHFSREEW